ncbi:MAG: hypothetical protein CBC01_05205 [Betaproteobacteria bacterium TMED41]|nr:MAG: hypothetical protein CBC01_05205 [Betaproteobacteria bacterium TMED41]
MNNRRKLIFSSSGFFLLGFAQSSYSSFEVLAVRIWPAKDHTRIAIEHKQKNLKIQTFILKNPERLVVDLKESNLISSFKNIISSLNYKDSYLGNIRVGQFNKNTLRVVFELKQSIKAKVFSLKPIAHYQNRLVIDLHPTEPIDPLLALLKEYGEPKGSSSQNLTNESKADFYVKKHNKFTIALDPGHGGEDPGAVGIRGTLEKDVVLEISKRLKVELEKHNAKVYLTRDADYFIPLGVRVKRARRVKADLFVSIHADAWIEPDAKGSSVYVLSDGGASSTSAKWLAKKENLSDLVGGVQLSNQEYSLAKTLLDMSTTAQIKDSSILGRSVLSNLSNVNVLHKKDVERAGFAVLKAPDIPSILIETAFISNPTEEKRLRNYIYQTKLASAISDGIFNYLNPKTKKFTG